MLDTSSGKLLFSSLFNFDLDSSIKLVSLDELIVVGPNDSMSDTV
jgi:hypothetical protein